MSLNGGITEWDVDHSHVWVAGMMYVDAEDVARVASERESIECEACEDGYPSYRLCPFGPESNGAA